MNKAFLFSIGQSKLISLLFALISLSAITYAIALLSLYHFPGSSEFKSPAKQHLSFIYKWTLLVHDLSNIYLSAVIIWIPLLLIVFLLKGFDTHRKSIWISGLLILLSGYLMYVSRIGAEWWSEYSLMIVQMKRG